MPLSEAAGNGRDGATRKSLGADAANAREADRAALI